jgi:hypothetical protein
MDYVQSSRGTKAARGEGRTLQQVGSMFHDACGAGAHM